MRTLRATEVNAGWTVAHLRDGVLDQAVQEVFGDVVFLTHFSRDMGPVEVLRRLVALNPDATVIVDGGK